MTHQVFPDATWIAGHTKPELLDAFAHGDAYHAGEEELSAIRTWIATALTEATLDAAKRAPSGTHPHALPRYFAFPWGVLAEQVLPGPAEPVHVIQLRIPVVEGRSLAANDDDSWRTARGAAEAALIRILNRHLPMRDGCGEANLAGGPDDRGAIGVLLKGLQLPDWRARFASSLAAIKEEVIAPLLEAVDGRAASEFSATGGHGVCGR